MSRHKVQKSSFGNNAAPKKSSSLNQASSWTNPYQQRNAKASEQPINTVKPPTAEEWLKDNIMLRAIETRQAQLQRQQLEENPGTEPQLEPVQAKLTVGKPGDKYEQEADMMASRVMSMPDNAVQRASAEVQTKSANAFTPIVQRAARPEMGGTSQASGNLVGRLNSSKGGGRPLPNDVRGFMEPRFGADFSQVRVHTDSTAVQMSRELGAQAFTHGSDVYYGEGKAPGNNELTAHELTHVVQQVGNTMQAKSSQEKAGTVPDQAEAKSNIKAKSKISATAQKIVDLARGEVGSTVWARAANRAPYGPPQAWKCNIFVYEIATKAGASIPLNTRFSWTKFSNVQYPPLATDWEKSSISGWSTVSIPQPGDVAAYSGHVGFVSSPKTTISANETNVVENDWGFRGGQKPVFKRYG
ncbi:hypothetical protein Cylst_4552 [Cylindrospermum stagnale PCC 7417]|uniref:eCIS core domain-containing protein n=1 Tax=Cylindrospermum stagnale PCC 7417 TaxID=56107 RepID=K9X1Y2_9NOST|nr:DUF4157 domain-containing protein [Cylindrospermum stagnale]AFZ26630.1 hypothetical protein Cylst_4552 [Cylindrospermum stagnale PCC 7417]